VTSKSYRGESESSRFKSESLGHESKSWKITTHVRHECNAGLSARSRCGWRCVGFLNKRVDEIVMNESDGQQHVHHLRSLVERTAPFVQHGTFSQCQFILFFANFAISMWCTFLFKMPRFLTEAAMVTCKIFPNNVTFWGFYFTRNQIKNVCRTVLCR